MTTKRGDLIARIAYCEGQMKRCELYASLWTTRITSGAILRRRPAKRIDDVCPYTDEETIDDALRTVEQHISNFNELLDHRDALIRELHGGSHSPYREPDYEPDTEPALSRADEPG